MKKAELLQRQHPAGLTQRCDRRQNFDPLPSGGNLCSVVSFLKCLDCLERRNRMHLRFQVQRSGLRHESNLRFRVSAIKISIARLFSVFAKTGGDPKNAPKEGHRTGSGVKVGGKLPMPGFEIDRRQKKPGDRAQDGQPQGTGEFQIRAAFHPTSGDRCLSATGYAR